MTKHYVNPLSRACHRPVNTTKATFQDRSMSSIVKCKRFRLKCCNRSDEIEDNGDIGRIYSLSSHRQANMFWFRVVYFCCVCPP